MMFTRGTWGGVKIPSAHPVERRLSHAMVFQSGKIGLLKAAVQSVKYLYQVSGVKQQLLIYQPK
jgi:hypothetical protein